MKVFKLKNRIVWGFTCGAFNDTAKWLLNKCCGKVVREKNWDSTRIMDYEIIQKLLYDDMYNYYLLESTAPNGGSLISSNYYFTAYEVTVLDQKGFSEKVLVFVPRKEAEYGGHKKKGVTVESF